MIAQSVDEYCTCTGVAEVMQLIKLRTYLRLYCLSFVNLSFPVEIRVFGRFYFQSKFSCATLSSVRNCFTYIVIFSGFIITRETIV